MTEAITTIFTLLLLTSFIKIFTALNILRYGLGLAGGGFGIVFAAIALALSLVVMEPHLGSTGGLKGLMFGEALPAGQIEKALSPFMQKHADPEVTKRLAGLGKEETPNETEKTGSADQSTSAEPSFGVLTASFVLSEVRSAFQVGLLLLIPFVVLDLVVANVLMALGSTQLPVALVALPLKLLLFVSIDGWVLVTERLLGPYLGG